MVRGNDDFHDACELHLVWRKNLQTTVVVQVWYGHNVLTPTVYGPYAMISCVDEIITLPHMLGRHTGP